MQKSHMLLYLRRCELHHTSRSRHRLGSIRNRPGGWSRISTSRSFPVAEGAKYMRAGDTSGHDATPRLIFAIGSGEEVARETLATAGTSFGPVCNHDGLTYPLTVDRFHPRADRDTIVNRLLDWSNEARRVGRVERAEYLVCLAWEAYDRAPD